MKLKNAKHVAEWRLCTGCGACAYICPKKNIKLVDVVNDGIRPLVDLNDCGDCNECIKVCPGYETIHYSFNGYSGIIPELKESWGPVFEIWEGYATDHDIRHNGSSGGLATALALYCLEKEGMQGVLHIGADEEIPWKNKTFFSTSSSDLFSRSGSRYSPASPCERMGRIESASGQCVFIGKPCDVAGMRKAQLLRPELDKNAGVTIGIFCAGTPSTAGTLDLLKDFDIRSDDVKEIRYRGKGWPGKATVRLKTEDSPSHKLSYEESWGFVQKYRPYRCYLCPDGTSEFADISCGDPWYRERKEEELGYSLVLVRTEKGRMIVRGAIESGYVTLESAEPKILEDSQKGMSLKRGTIWGRLITMKLLLVPTPRYNGFYLFKNWWGLPMKEKVRSLLGTARRIVRRGYYKPLKSDQNH
jgi:coenzyme F420 hydrogenase subunit beta